MGAAQYKPEKYATAPRMFHLDQVADLAGQALADAGLALQDLDGLVVHGPQFHEAGMFVPAMVGEHLGIKLDFAEVVDLGGASGVAAVWAPPRRSSWAVQRGAVRDSRAAGADGAARRPHGRGDEGPRFGGHSTRYGAPEAEMDLPYGHMAQNTGYAMIAQRYAAVHGYDAAALARIAVHQRANACANPDAMFFGQPLTVDEVLASRMVVWSLRMLEIDAGGRRRRGDRGPRRHRRAAATARSASSAAASMCRAKSPTMPPTCSHAHRPGLAPRLRDGRRQAHRSYMAQIYDCYTITVLLTLEDAGFAWARACSFVRSTTSPSAAISR